MHNTENLPLPQQMTSGSSGFDLYAAPEKPLQLNPGERALVPTGIAIAIPLGYEGQIRPRSGLALKQGITLLNTPGTIDSDYRGEIKVLVINLGQEPVIIQYGIRIAQLVICPVIHNINLTITRELPSSKRGEGGFGHTG